MDRPNSKCICPPHYDQSQARYPVVYIFDGTLALSEGKITTTLDNVIGNTVQPVMAVFLTELKTEPKPQEQPMEEVKAISDLLVKEVIPFVDSRYRTAPNAESRAIMASLATGYDGFHTVFNNPSVFGGIALQSIMIVENEMNELIPHDAEYPLRVYLDWGLYDARSYAEGSDLGQANKKFDAFLRERGYRPAGGEARDSYGWASWRNRTDRWLAALFPITKP